MHLPFGLHPGDSGVHQALLNQFASRRFSTSTFLLRHHKIREAETRHWSSQIGHWTFKAKLVEDLVCSTYRQAPKDAYWTCSQSQTFTTAFRVIFSGDRRFANRSDMLHIIYVEPIFVDIEPAYESISVPTVIMLSNTGDMCSSLLVDQPGTDHFIARTVLH